MQENYYRGQMYYADLGKILGPVQAKFRPVIIISNNRGNAHSGVVIVVPITSKEKKPLPTHCPINIGMISGWALCEQILTIPKDCISTFIGALTPYHMSRLDRSIMISLGLKDVEEPKSEDTKVEDNLLRSIETLKEGIDKQFESFYSAVGVSIPEQESVKKAVKVYKKRTPEEIQSFLREWDSCKSGEELDTVAKKYEFSSRSAARTFYSRHI